MIEQCSLDFDRISQVRETDDPDTALATAWCWLHRRYCQGLADVDVLASYGHVIGDDREPLELADAVD